MSNDKQPKYQVWHQSPDGFLPVALVAAGNLLAALVFTMNRVDAHWQDGDRVTALVPDARSTDIGDVIVAPEGVAYEITATTHGLVFAPIDFPPHREHMSLFAEWNKDYALAKVRDGVGALTAILNEPYRQPEPPLNDNEKDRDGGIER